MAEDQRIAYVTGATGMVGSHLTERLLKEGFRVRALVLESEDPSGLEKLGVECIRGDITDSPGKLREGVAGATHVFHCAAWVDDWAPRDRMVKVNVGGLTNLLEAVRGMKLRRFVFIGSIVVYGDEDLVNADERSRFVRTGDNYNHTKIECERVLRKFVRETGLAAVVLRPSYIYGERDNQFLPRVCRALLSREWIYIGWGRIPIVLSDVRDVAEACVLAATKDEAVGEDFIITDAEPVTRRELVEIVCAEMGYKRPFVSLPRGLGITTTPFAVALARFMNWDRPYLVNRFLCHFAGTRLTFDISKARRLLGYEPRRSPHESLREAVRWFRKNRPELLPKKRGSST